MTTSVPDGFTIYRRGHLVWLLELFNSLVYYTFTKLVGWDCFCHNKTLVCKITLISLSPFLAAYSDSARQKILGGFEFQMSHVEHLINMSIKRKPISSEPPLPVMVTKLESDNPNQSYRYLDSNFVWNTSKWTRNNNRFLYSLTIYIGGGNIWNCRTWLLEIVKTKLRISCNGVHYYVK